MASKQKATGRRKQSHMMAIQQGISQSAADSYWLCVNLRNIFWRSVIAKTGINEVEYALEV